MTSFFFSFIDFHLFIFLLMVDVLKEYRVISCVRQLLKIVESFTGVIITESNAMDCEMMSNAKMLPCMTLSLRLTAVVSAAKCSVWLCTQRMRDVLTSLM